MDQNPIYNLGDVLSQKIVNVDTLNGNIIVNKTNDSCDWFNVGLRQFNQQNYKTALDSFEKAISASDLNSDAYYYSSICLLNGRRPFLSRLPTIKKAEDYLNKALNIESKGIFYFLKYLIHKDFYEMKRLRSEVPSAELYTAAEARGVSNAEKILLLALLGL